MITPQLSAQRSLLVRRLSPAALLFLAFAACGSPANNSALFATGGAQASAGFGAEASASNGGSGGTGISTAGGSSAGGAGAGSAFAGESSGGGNGLAGGSEAGASGIPSTAGSANMLGGDCSSHGDSATYFAGSQHCYVAVHDMITFADANEKCQGLGAHLATIADADEDDFVWNLDPVEHWIGATDGKSPKVSQPGTYYWVTGEPFSYTDWSADQPNASKTACGDSNGGGDCYEHCGFQWTGGDHDGQWNDRYCLHTIESVCEWED